MEITTYTEAIDSFNDMMDECHPQTVIGFSIFSASRVLLDCDPIAYRCSFLDWLDSEGIDSDSLEGNYPF